MNSIELGSFPKDGVALIFGTSGGIGSALTELLTSSGYFGTVLGLSRNTTPAFELLNEASLEAAARFASSKGELRLVIDATGFLHDAQQFPEKTWLDLASEKLARSFAINAIGPALLMKHVLHRFPRDGKAAFATLSARVGSIGDNHLGGWYAYRASKAALNQLVRTAAIELRRRCPHGLCVALHPGTVATQLSAPFAKAGLTIHTPIDAAHHLLTVLNALGDASSGGFFDWRGKQVPW